MTFRINNSDKRKAWNTHWKLTRRTYVLQHGSLNSHSREYRNLYERTKLAWCKVNDTETYDRVMKWQAQTPYHQRWQKSPEHRVAAKLYYRRKRIEVYLTNAGYQGDVKATAAKLAAKAPNNAGYYGLKEMVETYLGIR